jgi:serine/threonine protein kinase
VDKVQGFRLSEIVANYRQRNELPSYILAVDWFEQAFRGLATIQAAGRMHGSIALEKIFVGADDEVRIEEAGVRSDFARSWPNTGISADVGCASPEQIAGCAVDRRSDLYSLGAAFYELLTLRRPGTSPDPPSSINRTVPKGFDAVLLRLLEVAPENRYASADEVLADLAALRRAPKSITAPALVAPPSEAIRPAGVPRAAMIAAGALFGVIGGTIAGWLLHLFLPATIVVGAIVGGVVGVFANPNA